MGREIDLRRWIVATVFACVFRPSYALDRRSIGTVNPFNSVTDAALIEFKNVLGRNPNNGSWGATWVRGTSCSQWQFTTCDPSTGNLLSLVLENKFLEGIIPASFYAITSLTKLDLSGNRLYGSVRRDLAVLNQGLVYLDLSNNFFTGNFPDLWPSPDIYAPDFVTFPYTIKWGQSKNEPMYIDVSNTFFSGFQTINVTNDNFKDSSAGVWPYYSFQCIGIQLGGSVNNSCFTKLANDLTQVDEGACYTTDSKVPTGYVEPQPRPDAQCMRWCGSDPKDDTFPSSVCQTRPNAHCVPTFASSSSNVVLRTQCLYANGSSLSPPTLRSVTVSIADAAALRTFIGALNLSSTQRNMLTPYLANPLTALCSALPRIACDTSGRIVALDLSGMGIQSVIPLSLSSLDQLVSLNLSRNRFFNTWPYTNLNTQLPNLERLDLNTNFLVGRLPTGFKLPPVFVNVSNNYFSGTPLIQQAKPPQMRLPFTYCPPDASQFMGLNCLATTPMTPCAPQPQRTLPACSSFCGIQKVGPLGAVGACGNGQVACLSSGQCNGTVTIPPYAGSTNQPIQAQSLQFFRERYTRFRNISIFSTWVPFRPCNGTWWQGLTCDSTGNVIAVNLRGQNLTGPFPGPSIFQELFWPQPGKVSRVKFVDLSNNQLYGNIDPMLRLVNGLDYLDVSGNFLTGRLPRMIPSAFQYLDLSRNYFVGSPVVLSQDNTTRLCPGEGFLGSMDSNCFDVAVGSSDPKCSRILTPRNATQCRSFCDGASSTKLTCTNDRNRRPRVCRPSTLRPFECAST